jgi:copper transport protein
MCLAAFMLCVTAAQADAHAVLLETTPQNNQSLTASPAEIRFVFNEVVTPVSVQLLDASAKRVEGTGSVTAIDATVHLKLPQSLPIGIYIASYRVISADSHPVSGSLVFGIGLDPLANPVATRVGTAPDAPYWQAIGVLLRLVFDGSLLIAAGGILFQILIPSHIGSESTNRLLFGAATTATISAVLLPVVLGAQLMAEPLTAFWHFSVWHTGVATSLGASMAIAITGLLLIVVGTMTNDRGMGLAIAVPGALIALAAFSLGGHAATAEPIWLSAPLLYLHTLCVAYWIGALIPIDRQLRAQPTTVSAPMVRRFSYHAVSIVPIAILCGIVIAGIQLRSFSALVTTAYGQRLFIKMGLVGALLLAAACNKFVLSRALARGRQNAAAYLRCLIRAELALIAAILAMTVLLSQSVPPREKANAMQAGVSAMVMEGDRMAMIDVAPGRPGPNRLAIQLTNNDSTPLDPLSVTVWLGNPALGIEPMKFTPEKENAGRYVVPAAIFPVSGNWTVTVETVVTDFDETNFTADAPIR